MKREYSYEEYMNTMKLLNMGMGPTEVSRILNIPRRAVEDWKYKGKIPWLAKWASEPSNELAYVIGVLLGDGYIVREHHSNYDIELMVKDYEFAEEFSKAIAKILDKKYKKPYWSRSHNRWRVYYRSKAFYTWYRRQDLDTLKQYIEHNRETVANFLRGFYDSDGNNYRYKHIFLYNSNLKLLRYTQYLLKKYFSIKATGPYLIAKAGSIHIKRNGERIKTNHDIYCIAISRMKDIRVFLSEIGFSIREKQLGLPRKK